MKARLIDRIVIFLYKYKENTQNPNFFFVETHIGSDPEIEPDS